MALIPLSVRHLRHQLRSASRVMDKRGAAGDSSVSVVAVWTVGTAAFLLIVAITLGGVWNSYRYPFSMYVLSVFCNRSRHCSGLRRLCPQLSPFYL